MHLVATTTVRARLARHGPNHPISRVHSHPLEARLRKWDDTQRVLRQQILRRNLGKAEPIRRDMELKSIRDSQWRPVSICGPQASIHEDILLGKDDTIDWGDVFGGVDMRLNVEIHVEMETRLNI